MPTPALAIPNATEGQLLCGVRMWMRTAHIESIGIEQVADDEERVLARVDRLRSALGFAESLLDELEKLRSK